MKSQHFKIFFHIDFECSQDVSEFVEGGGGAASDSEVDEDSSKVRCYRLITLCFHIPQVILPDKFVGRGNSKAQQSAMVCNFMSLYYFSSYISEIDRIRAKNEIRTF